MTAVVRFTGVAKHYQRDSTVIPVLDHIDLSIEQADFLALMGPSGSGKTTILNLIAGIDRPNAGTVEVAGTNLGPLGEGDLARWRSHHIGFVFQMFNLIPVLTAFENVELPLLLLPMNGAERRRRVADALALVGLTDRAAHYPRQLSGGQEQRVAIARSFVTDPTIILADEPTGDLDSHSAEETMGLLKRLNSELGKTILLVTHDPRAAEAAKNSRHLTKGKLE